MRIKSVLMYALQAQHSIKLYKELSFMNLLKNSFQEIKIMIIKIIVIFILVFLLEK